MMNGPLILNGKDWKSTKLNQVVDVSSSPVSGDSLHSSDDIYQDQSPTSSSSPVFSSKQTIVEICTSKNIESEDCNLNDSFKNEIKEWALSQNVSHSQLNSLLTILEKYHPELPTSSKTLLCTKRNLDIREMTSARDCDGEYYNFGLKSVLIRQLKMGVHKVLNSYDIHVIKFICNVDGLPIFKSSSCQIWLILVSIYIKSTKTKPFIVSIFKRNSKPGNLDEFLNDYIVEVNDLITNGL
ncbi:hypothetical protein ILUMI_02457 [Ignelater luminosus]|uniref:Uncharacterized protein n=1 Tax=Ignelater luminosus TaxID=2038154 RepID=A0A8K0GJ92_IGNLU|nr:hypothetical protein ILUMI_02457 [Ignelater luminosus]